MKDNFLIAKKHIDRLQTEIFNSFHAFYLYKFLYNLRNTLAIDKEIAIENTEVMNKHKNFWVSIEYSSLDFFILHAVNLFDRDPESISFYNLKKIVKSNANIFTRQAFANYCKKTKRENYLLEKYEGAHDKRIGQFDEILSKQQNNLELLRKARNKIIAHIDKGCLDGHRYEMPSFVKLESFFEDMYRMLNIYDSALYSNSSAFGHIKNCVENDVRDVFSIIKKEIQARSSEWISATEGVKLGKYKHFKGEEVEVIGVAKHSETLEELVVYKTLKDAKGFSAGTLWARPLKMFVEKVEKDGRVIDRFSYIG